MNADLTPIANAIIVCGVLHSLVAVFRVWREDVRARRIDWTGRPLPAPRLKGR